MKHLTNRIGSPWQAYDERYLQTIAKGAMTIGALLSDVERMSAGDKKDGFGAFDEGAANATLVRYDE